MEVTSHVNLPLVKCVYGHDVSSHDVSSELTLVKCVHGHYVAHNLATAQCFYRHGVSRDLPLVRCV